MTNLEKIKQIMNNQDIAEGVIYTYQLSNVDSPDEIEYPELKDTNFSDDYDGIPIIHTDMLMNIKLEMIDDTEIRFNDDTPILINYAVIAMPSENHPWYIIKWVDEEQLIRFLVIPVDWIGRKPDSFEYKDVIKNDYLRGGRNHFEAGAKK